MKRNDVLDNAKKIINGERQGTYGNAEDSFSIIAQMWTACLGKDITADDVANMMILMKLLEILAVYIKMIIGLIFVAMLLLAVKFRVSQ